MTKLYIANTSRQRYNFLYRIPEDRDVKRVNIEPLHQAMVFEGRPDDVEYIIQQHRIYGLQRSTDLTKPKGFVGICYNLDAPITLDKLVSVDENNYKALTERGKESREKLAHIATATIATAVKAAGQSAEGLEIEIKDMSETPEFHEIFSEHAPVDAPSAKRRSRRK